MSARAGVAARPRRRRRDQRRGARVRPRLERALLLRHALAARPCPCPDCPVTLHRAPPRDEGDARLAAGRDCSGATADEAGVLTHARRSRRAHVFAVAAPDPIGAAYARRADAAARPRRRRRPPASLTHAAPRNRLELDFRLLFDRELGMRTFAFALSLAFIAGCNDSNSDKQNQPIGTAVHHVGPVRHRQVLLRPRPSERLLQAGLSQRHRLPERIGVRGRRHDLARRVPQGVPDTAPSDCRTAEGYVCKMMPDDASASYCDVPEAAGDGGA